MTEHHSHNTVPLSSGVGSLPDQANMLTGSYELAVSDADFLNHEDMRGTRLMLEYQKAESALRAQRIHSTIVAFGGARVPSPEQAQAQLLAARTPEELAMAKKRASQTRWYDLARDFGRIASERGGALSSGPGEIRQNVVATGGGPGLMEAANRGAHDAGAPSVGFNITLPFEERPNPYSSPELTFRFQYFGIRKIHLAMRCSALAVMPGGFGTLDEAFELLNLYSTKVDPVPMVFFDRAYWTSVINFDAMLEHGMISPSAMRLFTFADTAEEGWQSLLDQGLQIGPAAPGSKATPPDRI